MCLLVLAWKSHPRYRLVVAANRDEFHDRPATPLGWWADDRRILAGRDARGGGTWLGVARAGRFAAVTNFRDLETPPADAPSRGGLVADFLRSDDPPGAYLEALVPRAAAFAGFNLLVADEASLHYASNRSDDTPRELAPGVHALANHLLDTPWPKLLRTRERFARLLAQDTLEASDLFDLLDDRREADVEETPDTGLPPDWERALSAPFVVHPQYGTRCSSVLLVTHAGETTLHERRFDPSGRQSGATRVHFLAGGSLAGAGSGGPVAAASTIAQVPGSTVDVLVE